MKLNDLLNIIASGWEYTIILNITNDGKDKFPCELCRDMRRGQESSEFLEWLRDLDLEVAEMFGKDALYIHTKLVTVEKWI
ncbi:MAG: hypothetical protein IIY21_12345 [Clostridiales bacterium]|nr:hypothetical protein [Clostridiales bacterium]